MEEEKEKWKKGKNIMIGRRKSSEKEKGRWKRLKRGGNGTGGVEARRIGEGVMRVGRGRDMRGGNCER